MENQKQYFSRQILKITGDIIQVSKFAKEFAVGQRQYKSLKKDKDVDEEIAESFLVDPEETRIKNFKRAKRNIIDLINTNVFAWKDEKAIPYMPVFLTLTFGDNVTDLITANYEYTKFIRRMNWEAFDEKKSILKYVVVIEFQKRGAIHYHAIIFNMPFVGKEKIMNIWGNGFIKIKAIDNVHDVGFYVTKYMAKDLDDPRLQDRKSYFTSKNLIKPTILYIEELINLVKKLIPSESKEYEKFDLPVKYLSYMDCWRYNLKNYPEAKQEILKLLNQYL